MTRGKKEACTPASMHLRFRINLDLALAYCRTLDKTRSGSITFSQWVYGMYDMGPAPLHDKIEGELEMASFDFRLRAEHSLCPRNV